MSENPFDALDARDGYRVFKNDLGDLRSSLHLGVFAEGLILPQEVEAEETVTLWERECPSAQDLAERERARLLAEAVANYFNAGGRWPELNDIVRTMQQFVLGGLYFEGYHLLDCYVDTDGNHTVVYVKDDTEEVVRWVRGQFIDTGLTLQDLQREQLEEADERQDGAVYGLRGLQHSEGTPVPEGDADRSCEDVPEQGAEG